MPIRKRLVMVCINCCEPKPVSQFTHPISKICDECEIMSIQKMDELVKQFFEISICVSQKDLYPLEKTIINDISSNVNTDIKNSFLDYTTMTTDICITEIKQKGIVWVENLLKKDITHTKPGSISYLLYGKKPSEQSINIKMGRFGEYIAKELIKLNGNLELLNCGIQQINDKKKDVDLIFKNEEKKIIYYRELKGNIELDTEKLPATISKCIEIEQSLKQTYDGYEIDFGILNWSVYDRKILTAGLSNIKSFENGRIKIDHMEDFLKIMDIRWEEEDYYAYFREMGNNIKQMF